MSERCWLLVVMAFVALSLWMLSKAAQNREREQSDAVLAAAILKMSEREDRGCHQWSLPRRLNDCDGVREKGVR